MVSAVFSGVSKTKTLLKKTKFFLIQTNSRTSYSIPMKLGSDKEKLKGIKLFM